MGWATTGDAITALRNLIFDGPKDKLCSNKKLIGVIDGSNLTFKTFEYRRNTNFTVTNTFPFGVFKNGTALALGKVTADDPDSGTFQIDISVVPVSRDTLSATYYYQWFTDAELDNFLQNSSTWLGYGTHYEKLVDGLNGAALRFAAQEAYLAAAMKYSTRMSEIYQLEDAPSEDILKSVAAFQSMADSFMDKARDLRDDYYTRQGQSLSPNFAFQLGKVVDPTPRR